MVGRLLTNCYGSTSKTALVGASRVTTNAWIKSGPCIGVSNLRRSFKLPRWQFEPAIWPALQPIAKSLSTSDGWQLLACLESPAPALDGQTPRAALTQSACLIASWRGNG
ncbi:MAG: hypothetical protein Q7T21_02525 [Gallionella sp.]|nr:hypothetical protein [Gallionella sp.]